MIRSQDQPTTDYSKTDLQQVAIHKVNLRHHPRYANNNQAKQELL